MEIALVLIGLLIFYFIFERNRKLSKLNNEHKFDTAYLDNLMENSNDGILLLDNNDKIIKANEAFERIFQYKSEDIKGVCCNDIIATDDTRDAYEASRIILEGGTYSTETKRARKDGVLIDVHLIAFPVIIENNQVGLCAIYSDLSSKKKAERELELQQNYFTQLFENSPEAICIIDNKDRFINVNSAFEKLFGYSKDELINQYLNDRIVQPDSIEEATNISKRVISGSIIEEETYRMRKDGSLVEVCILGYPILFHEKQIGVFGIYRDIAEKKKFERELKYLSYHDQLTGLYNRRFFEEQLKVIDKEINFPLSVFMADVNGLKLVNDSFGHTRGDELLKKVVEILRKCCKAEDIIARLGGDEFVILSPKTTAEDAREKAAGIKAEALQHKSGSVDISISIGFETKYSAEENILGIIKKAEDHMYKNKLFESPSMRGKTINTIISTLHEKNKREEQHSHRVSALCVSIGQALGLNSEEIAELKTVGLLHDIGKIAIDENILNKPGKLTELEWEVIKRHSEIGYRILGTVSHMSEMAEYVLAHHERWDGKGYPKGLKGEKIPLNSRIICIADTYDAMTSERSYRSAMSEETAIKEILDNAGTQFDPKLAEIFVNKVIKSV
ncbi:MAG: PAS domain S-box protein [Solirubrobacterales bacterium]